MRAVVQDGHRSAEALEVRRLDLPVPADDEVLVHACAASTESRRVYVSTSRA